MRRLIINADDFGLTRGVVRAVMELKGRGALTSATLMARAAATEEAIEAAKAAPGLRVGCHVVLLDGEPALSPHDIFSLVDRKTGQFHSTLGAFLLRTLTGHIKPEEIEGEAAAQISLLQDRGLRLTHVDTHKHTHMFPSVLRPLLRAARAAGISAVRNPFEPSWSRRATAVAPVARRIEVAALRQLEPAFHRIVSEEGFRTTDGTIGVLATGTLNSAVIDSLLAKMPEGTWELVTHPGYNDSELRQMNTRLTESREGERRALTAMGEPVGLELISFADLATDML